MKTTNSSASPYGKSFLGMRNHFVSSQRSSHRVSNASEEDDSDSDEDERERRKYLSLSGGQNLFWSSNRLNKNLHSRDTSDFLEDRTASMSSFKRNSLKRHSLKHFRRRPLANISDVELYDSFRNRHTVELSENAAAIIRKSVTLDDIEMNDGGFEYGFNPQRVSGSEARHPVRLRPISVCISPSTPSKEADQAPSPRPSSRNNGRGRSLRKVTSYATNKNEVRLERELINLRSQSCSLNFQGCEGNMSKDQLKESISALKRHRFVCRKLNLDYHPNKWKKTVSLDSGLATTDKHHLMDTSKSEEKLRRKQSRKKLDNLNPRKKSVEFLDVHKEGEDGPPPDDNELALSSESDENQEPVETNEEDGRISCASPITISPSDIEIDISPTHSDHTPTGADETATTLLDTIEATSGGDDITITPDSTPSSDIASNDKFDMTKSSERIKRLKSQLFSSFRLPGKNTFRKLLIRRKAPEDTGTPLKASHDIKVVQLFGDEIAAAEGDESNQEHIRLKLDDEEYEVEPLGEETCGDADGEVVIMVADVGGDGDETHDIQCGSMESLNSYEKATMRSSNRLLDKSVSAYSLPRVDEDKEFSSSLERRSKSSCSISVNTHKSGGEHPRLHHPHHHHHHSLTDHHHGGHHHTARGPRHMSECDLTTYEDRPTGCSPGKRLMRRILSPVVCGFPPHNVAEKYGTLTDSLQSLNSYDTASIASDCEHLQLFDFSSQELVEEMTLIDKELLARIPWEELAVLGWMSPEKFMLAPNVMKMVQFFNRIAMLVTSNVLNEESTYRRAKIIKKAIKLAFKCRVLKNFNSLKAVLGGLQCTPVFRLKATWKEVPSRYRKTFRELSELMSEDNNFHTYRKALNISILEPPCMPFLGNFLTEVAHIHAFHAIHAEHSSPLPSQKQCPHWAKDGTNINSTGDEHSQGEDVVDNKTTVSRHPTELIPDRVCTDYVGCGCQDSLRTHPFTNTHSRTNSDLSDGPRETTCACAEESLETNNRNKSMTDSDPDLLQESICLDCSTDDHDEEVPSGKCLCKARWRTDSECSATDLLRSLRKCHIRTDSEISNTEPVPTHPATHPGTKVHSRTDSDDSGVVLSNANKRYSNYIEELESPRENSILPNHTDHILPNQLPNERVTDVEDTNTPTRSTTKNSKLSDCEKMFGKLQLYGMAYNFVHRPYIRTILTSSAFNTEETSYKLSLKREPPKR